MNTQTVYWSADNSTTINELIIPRYSTRHHYQILTFGMWCAIGATSIMGPFCYSDTLISEIYIGKIVARLFLVCENLNTEINTNSSANKAMHLYSQ
jgi:hypothetical protein